MMIPGHANPPPTGSLAAPTGGAAASAASRGQLTLDGPTRRTLHNALIAAYPSQADLAQLVAFTLNENLAAIAGGENL